jgi:hypothetical protein
LEKWYGKEKAAGITKIESFEICEYGLQPKDADIRRLFPMLPMVGSESVQNKQPKKWISLFDGKSLNGWHIFNKVGPINNWMVKDKTLVCLGAISGVDYGGDIVTNAIFSNFELVWDWKLDSGSNSGLMYHVLEGSKYNAPYETGPEFQLMDDAAYANGRADANQQAGSDYGMYAPTTNKMLKPIGEWNHSKLIFNNGHVEHWLNNVKVVEFMRGSEDWKRRKQLGKWKSFMDYGNSNSGRICLQDHGHKAYFKNIFIRKL